MARPAFTPTLLVGLGEFGCEILFKLKELTAHWHPSLQALIQTLQVENYAELCSLLPKSIGSIKNATLLQNAETQVGITVRTQFGPLEINVFVLGEIGRTSAEVTLEQVVELLLAQEYAWPPSQGYTGATITTIAAISGNTANQRFDLSKLLELYRQEEFLDAYAGRMLLVDGVRKDGSKLDFADLTSAIARCLYASIFPGDEPLLLPQLGLIRKKEKEIKLTTIGITCLYSSWRESLKEKAKLWLKELAEQVSSESESLEQIQAIKLLEGLDSLLLRSSECTQGSLANLKTSKEAISTEIDNVLGSCEPPKALQLVKVLEAKVLQLREEVYDRCNQLDKERISYQVPEGTLPVLNPPGVFPEVEEYISSKQHHGRSWYSFLSLLGLALIYRITANQVIPLWLGWVVAALVVLINLFCLFPTSGLSRPLEAAKDPESTWKLIQPPLLPEIRPLDRQTEHKHQQLYWDEFLLLLAGMRSELEQWRDAIRCLARVSRAVAEKLSGAEGAVLNRSIDLTGSAEVNFFQALLPSHWWKYEEEELAASLMEGIFNLHSIQQELPLPAGLLDKGSLEQIKFPSQPLLMYGEAKPLKVLTTVACNPILWEDLNLGQGVNLVQGPGDLICAVTFYFGIDPTAICL